MEVRMEEGRRKWKRGWWEEAGNGREDGGRKVEMEERMVGGQRNGRKDRGKKEELKREWRDEGVMEERMVGGRRKWNRGWWEEAGNGREDGGMKEGMEERMVG